MPTPEATSSLTPSPAHRRVRPRVGPPVRFALAVAATALLLAACSGGSSGPVERYVLDGRYQIETRVTDSEDPRVPEGARATGELIVETLGDTATLTLDGTELANWAREDNTLRWVGRLDGCDGRLTLRWSGPDRFRGSGRDVCNGMAVRYVTTGERTTTPFTAPAGP